MDLGVQIQREIFTHLNAATSKHSRAWSTHICRMNSNYLQFLQWFQRLGRAKADFYSRLNDPRTRSRRFGPFPVLSSRGQQRPTSTLRLIIIMSLQQLLLHWLKIYRMTQIMFTNQQLTESHYLVISGFNHQRGDGESAEGAEDNVSESGNRESSKDQRMLMVAQLDMKLPENSRVSSVPNWWWAFLKPRPQEAETRAGRETTGE